MVTAVVEAVYRFLWGDLFTIPLGNGNGIGIPLLVLLLIPTGVYFTIRTRFLPIRLFPDMIRALNGKKQRTLAFSFASPTPMLITTLSSFGTSMMFLYPNFFINASTISFWYFSFSLLNFCDLLSQLINYVASFLGKTNFFVSVHLESDSCRLTFVQVHYI